MKLFAALLFSPMFCLAQTQTDTLSKQNEQLLRLVSGFIKTEMQKQLKEDGTANGVKGLLGSTIKDVLKNTAQKSANELINIDLGSKLSLPNVLLQNKEAISSKGKETLVTKFKESLRYATNDALGKVIPMMVAQAIEFNVDSLVAYAAGGEVGVTGIFKNASRTKLLEMVEPIASQAFQSSYGKRNLKKLGKTLQSITGNELVLNPSDQISLIIVNEFLNNMQGQEQKLKSNPLGALESILNLFKD